VPRREAYDDERDYEAAMVQCVTAGDVLVVSRSTVAFDRGRAVQLGKGDRCKVLENDGSLEWPFHIECLQAGDVGSRTAWVSASKVELPLATASLSDAGSQRRRSQEPLGVSPQDDGWVYAESVQDSFRELLEADADKSFERELAVLGNMGLGLGDGARRRALEKARGDMEQAINILLEEAMADSAAAP